MSRPNVQAKVAVSYAWGAEETGAASGAVDEFCRQLRSRGLEVVRDKDGLDLGQGISAFMRSVGASGFLCIFLSDAYLRSPSCMYELLVAWQTNRDDPDEFGKRVKVWIMPDVRGIEGLEGRRVYLKYWEGEKSKAKRNLDAISPESLSPGSLEEYRRIKDISDNVDGILHFLADRLSPASADQFTDWIEGHFRQVLVGYEGNDRARAEDLAKFLEGQGFTAGTRALGAGPDPDWIRPIRDSLRSCSAVIVLLGDQFRESKLVRWKWVDACRLDPLGDGRALIPVRVGECDPGELRIMREYCDWVGLDGQNANRILLQTVLVTGLRPIAAPTSPALQSEPLRRPSDPPPPPPTKPTSGSSVAEDSDRPVLDHVLSEMERQQTPDLLLHTFFGLSGLPNHGAPQDHTTVYYLWAHAEGSWISANLEPKDASRGQPRHFVVRFFNAPRTYSSNVAFRPGGTGGLDNTGAIPRRNGAARRYLSFEARRPEPEGPSLGVIAMGYRVIDRLGTHWSLQRGARIDLVADSRWTPFNIDLGDRGWSVFTSDGNHLYAGCTPDFSLIVAAVIDFGSDQGETARPGAGLGEVHIRNFRLRDTPLLEVP